MSEPAIETFRRAAGENLNDPRRQGGLVTLGEGEQVTVAGDIHGHRRNFTKIVSHAACGDNPARRIIFQELIHAPLETRSGQDRSVDLLLRAARLKVSHPRQVLFVLGNHDLSQITGGEIVKNGHGACRAFAEGVRYAFGDSGPEALAAVTEFLQSFPVAVKCPNGVLISHSLPSPGKNEQACMETLTRTPQADDLRRGGCIYQWVWGRGHTPEQIEALAGKLSVEFFVIGHRKMPSPWENFAPRALALTSEDDGDCIVEFSTDTPMNEQTAVESIRAISSL